MSALRHVGKDGNYWTLNLFTQGMALAVEITSEVKFFEIKIEELVVSTPMEEHPRSGTTKAVQQTHRGLVGWVAINI